MAQWVYLIPTVLGETMARRRRRRPVAGERDLFTPEFDNLLSDPITSGPPLLPLAPLQAPLDQAAEDLRTFDPDGPGRWPRSRNGRRSTWRSRASSSKTIDLPRGPNLRFDDPRAVMICVRRQQRKEVLHALKRSGKAGGFRRRPRRNQNSNIWCK